MELNYDDGQDRLYVYGLEPSTNYVVRLLPGMADIYGYTINNEYSFSFETAGLDPSAALLVPYYPLIYRANAEKQALFEYTNLTSAKLSPYSLSYTKFRQPAARQLPADQHGLLRQESAGSMDSHIECQQRCGRPHPPGPGK